MFGRVASHIASTTSVCNSVGTPRLKKDAVTSKKDPSLLRKDFKSGQLPAGPPGPKGDPGATTPESAERVWYACA
jgi:hypothetical protein